jgi:hypothetical protein
MSLARSSLPMLVLACSASNQPPGGMAGAPTPTLVQHLSSTSTNPGQGVSGNNYRFTLPNPVLAGNCLILGVSYDWASNRTVSISDDNGNTWPGSPTASTTDGASYTSAIYVLPNARAGITTITVTFDALIATFQYTISEFDNIATVSPVSGTSTGQSTAPNLSTATFTPGNNDANGGNLIWTYFWDNVYYRFNDVTTISAGTSFSLLDAGIAGTGGKANPCASEYHLQRSSAAITPSMTATMTGGNDTYNGVSVALMAAPAGTAPAAGGIRIRKICHMTNGAFPTTWVLQFPCTGNFILLTTIEPSIFDITSVTDSRGNTYTKVNPRADEPQFWYAKNATPDLDLKVTVTSSASQNASIQLWDITGADTASPIDAIGDLSGAAMNPGTFFLDDAPTITPPSANGLTVAGMKLGTGPCNGFHAGQPPGAMFDFVYYTNETDLDQMDNADARGHYYNGSDLSVEHWNWTRVPASPDNGTTAAAVAIHIKAAATP